MDRMSEILDGLIKKTQEGKLTWRTLMGRDSFVTTIEKISVVIRQDSSEQHRLSILNDYGVTAQELRTPSPSKGEQPEIDATPEQAQKLSLLFTLARRSALKTDTTLDELAKSLANFS